MLRTLISLIVASTLALSGCNSSNAISTESVEEVVATDGIVDSNSEPEGSPSPEPATASPVSGETPTEQPVPTEPAVAVDDRVNTFLESFERFRWQRVAEFGHFPVGDIEATLGGDVFPQQLPAGSYSTNALGTELTFELQDTAIVARELPGMLTFIDVDLAGTLHIGRPNAAFTAQGALSSDIFFNYDKNTEPMPEDFDQWLRAIAQLQIGETVETTVAGQPAMRYELAPLKDDFFFCNRGTCLNLFHVGPDQIKLFGHQQTVLWHIAHPGGDLVIVSKADPDAHARWLEFAEQLIDSFSLGEPAESPINSNQFWGGWGIVGPGQWSMPGLPWAFELGLAETAANHKNGYLSLSPPTGPGVPRYGMTIAKFVETRAGDTVSLETFDELLRTVYGDDDVIVEVEAAEILGHEARTFDVGPSSRDLEFKHAADAPNADVLGTDNYALIPVSSTTRLWVFEHDDDLWVAAAGAETEELLPSALELADDILSTAHIPSP